LSGVLILIPSLCERILILISPVRANVEICILMHQADLFKGEVPIHQTRRVVEGEEVVVEDWVM